MLVTSVSRASTSAQPLTSKKLFRFLLRQSDKLPQGPREHYRFQIKQSFKQHKTERDPERIQQIIKRSYEDAEWVMKKYYPEKN